MKALTLLALACGTAILSGCASGEVQASDLDAYKKAGLPNGATTETKGSERPER